MPMQSPNDLFMHDLSDIYGAEQMIVNTLPMLASEASNDQLKRALQEHEQVTRHQIQNLDQVFNELGTKPMQIQCFVLEGLKREYEEFKKEQPSEQILTAFIEGSAAKTEHYEIASYRGLVGKARLLGLHDGTRLLQENLDQEEQMAQTVEQIGIRLGEQMIQTPISSEMGDQPEQTTMPM